MKTISGFLIFLFGIMFGYGWQQYHHKLLVGDLKQAIVANQQKIDALIKRSDALRDEIKIEQAVQRVVFCESSYKHNAVGDGGRSFGPAQFQKRTFNLMKNMAHKPELQWKNAEHQIWLLKWAIKNGYGNHWSCFQKVKEDA